MRFGVFYELQLPKPWLPEDEQRIYNEALEQIVLADTLGIDYAWAVEHHFLDEYSHCSAPEVFLATAAAKTKNIKIGHGVRHVIPNYNHPARVAEGLGALDILSNGRLQFGFGEGATRLELGGFHIPAKEKRALALQSVEEIVKMMTMTPYPGFSGDAFDMPCRNVIPKPLQKPHPPLWMACTNRDTIKIAAKLGVGALAFSFVDPGEAATWTGIYYDIIKSEECRPIGQSVNANIAMVSAFSIHEDRQVAIDRGQANFNFFGYALRSLVVKDTVPGRTNIWDEYVKERNLANQEAATGGLEGVETSGGIGTPDDVLEHLMAMREGGVDQVILMQQAGKSKNAEICESLRTFAEKVMPVITAGREAEEAQKKAELQPYIDAALKRRKPFEEMDEAAIPVVKASVPQVEINGR